MKNIFNYRIARLLFLIIFILSNTFFVSAQNLTMGQLLEVRKKTLGDVEDYLTAKNWEFSAATEPSLGKMGKATFTFLKNFTSDRAQSFLTYYYSEVSSDTRINIQVHKKEKYTEDVNAIRAFGCKMISSKVENGQIVKVYRGATTTFEITSGTVENEYNEDSAIWTFFILSNDDYDINWGD